MSVLASITTSVDGYVTGPDDGPGQGLGRGGERLHYWVMGGPWTYDTEHEPGAGMGGADKEFLDDLVSTVGAGICGRGMYDAAGAWGGTGPATRRIRPPGSSSSTTWPPRCGGPARWPTAATSRSAAVPT